MYLLNRRFLVEKELIILNINECRKFFVESEIIILKESEHKIKENFFKKLLHNIGLKLMNV